MVYTSPATLKVEVTKCGIIDTVVDTVYVSVPGMQARSLTASEKRYGHTYFSSHRKEETDAETKVASGLLLHRVEWVGEGSKMPTIGTKTAQ